MKKAGWLFGALLIVVAIAGITYAAPPRLNLLSFAGVGLAVLAIYCAVGLRGTRAGNLFVSLAAVGLFISLLDPYVALTQVKETSHAEGSWTEKYHFVGDKDLGIVMPAGIVAESRRVSGDHVDYDVTYTIDRNGHRMTMGSNDPAADNVLFMGCSFTFGQGLNDNQTLPQQFSDVTGRRYNIVNFGVPGYGLHQEVRALELGLPEPFLKQGKRYIVYSAIADHARRAGGAYTWAVQGPAYKLGSDGIASFYGNLHSVAMGTVITTMTRSAFLAHFVVERLIRTGDFDPLPLYVGLVRRARQVAEEKYHATFIMIFWDDETDGSDEPRLRAMLDQEKISYIPVTSIIPDLVKNAATYRVTPVDGHPSEAANRLIAAYLAKHLPDNALTP